MDVIQCKYSGTAKASANTASFVKFLLLVFVHIGMQCVLNFIAVLYLT